MILFPAIDLKDGTCVRLVRGDMASATVFNRDPAAQAGRFAKAGFTWLHVVDLDGAIAGRSLNGAAIAAIRDAVDLRIQLGGGIRDRAAIDHWLALGIDRVVLGTAALRDPWLVREAAADHPGKIGVGLHARDGHVAVAGRPRTTEFGVIELARSIHSDSWAVPTLNGSPFLEQPPLYYWAVAAGYRVCGTSVGVVA